MNDEQLEVAILMIRENLIKQDQHTPRIIRVTNVDELVSLITERTERRIRNAQ